jgi:acetyl-CoA carboxylase carboxyltransferase component
VSADVSSAAGVIEAWKRAKEEQAKWKNVVSALEEKIIDALGGEEEGHIDGVLVITNRRKTVHRFDVKALREKDPELAEQFTTENDERAGLKAVGS